MTDVHAQAPEPDDYLTERARLALAADPRVGGLGSSVSLVDGRAFVSGEVATPERQAAAAKVVGEARDGYEAHNDVTVTPLARAFFPMVEGLGVVPAPAARPH